MIGNELLPRQKAYIKAEIVINSIESQHATTTGEKTPNHSVHLTPEAMAFFTFIISR